MQDRLRVFVSSTIRDLKDERAAAKEAILALGLEPIRVEDFGASATSPRDATLGLVDTADIYIGIFGVRYGHPVRSDNLSATELEYLRAKDARNPSKLILIYIKDPAPGREALLKRFLDELQEYDSGHLRGTFATPAELGAAIKRDLLAEMATHTKRAISLPIASSAPSTSAALQASSSPREFGGIMKLLREQVLRHVVEQLDSSVKRFKTDEAVGAAIEQLVSRIRADGFAPDQVIGWHNSNSLYYGSEIVAKQVALRLGTPLAIMEVQEIGEDRSVVAQGDLADSLGSALIVDDACYSGNTLKVLGRAVSAARPEADVRFAVLTKQSGKEFERLYYVTEHATGELLFPWGWSRHIVSLYDVFRYFGISDRRVVVRSTSKWGTVDLLASTFSGSVAVLYLTRDVPVERDDATAADVFVYVASGQVSVEIGHARGEFSPGEYIFLPRGVEFVLRAVDTATIVQLSTAVEQLDHGAVRLALATGQSG